MFKKNVLKKAQKFWVKSSKVLRDRFRNWFRKILPRRDTKTILHDRFFSLFTRRERILTFFTFKRVKIFLIFFFGVIVGVLIQHYIQNYFKHHFVPNEYLCVAYETARRHDLDYSLLFAIIQQESAWNPKAVSPRGAIGLMQIMPATAEYFCGLGRKQLFDPEMNLECGTAYFIQQLKNFGSVKLALCAYNAGPTRVRKLGRCPNFKETIQYTKSILKKWKGGGL